MSLVLNCLALIISLTGSWVLVSTRRRQRVVAAMRRPLNDASQRARRERQEEVQREARVDFVFYAAGFAGLGLGLAVSWLSRVF
ncbi:hypothetical protein [Stutzerimonas kirkiae]|uniref:hypothetical protein n=1 Tax=Stutzerimonas kirkiae TaxID=2211392 RepID=UPI001F60F03B|nr:hypothetical protein [Stutzerimonas kirkiae]